MRLNMYTHRETDMNCIVSLKSRYSLFAERYSSKTLENLFTCNDLIFYLKQIFKIRWYLSSF